MGKRFLSHDRVSLLAFALIETPGRLIEAGGVVGSLDKRPGEVFIAIFGIALAFLFTGAGLLAIHTTAIGGKVTHLRKAANIARFQHNRERENLADPKDAQKGFELRAKTPLAQYGLLDLID